MEKIESVEQILSESSSEIPLREVQSNVSLDVPNDNNEEEENVEEERPIVGPPKLSLLQLFWLFLTFGFRAFGGPFAQIALMKQHLVEEGNWITPQTFNRVLAVYQVLPGPEASELACYFGYVARGRPGALVAGLGFVLPGFGLMLLCAWLYSMFGFENNHVRACFLGIQPIVTAMVFRAMHKIGTDAFVHPETRNFDGWLMLIGAFSAIQGAAEVPFFVTLLLAAVLYPLFWNTSGDRKRIYGLRAIAFAVIAVATVGYVLFVYFVGIPNVVLFGDVVISPEPHYIFLVGLLGGLLTFGGAYTAIPFIAQIAVTNGHWITNQQFLDGIAIGSILPAPLVIFVAFIGFVSKGVVGSLLMTLGMYLPAFSFTLIGHKFFERVVHMKLVESALAGVTAAVVGLIVVAAFQMLQSAVTSVHSGVLFMIGLYSLYTFNHKLTTVILIIVGGVAGEVLFYRTL